VHENCHKYLKLTSSSEYHLMSIASDPRMYYFREMCNRQQFAFWIALVEAFKNSSTCMFVAAPTKKSKADRLDKSTQGQGNVMKLTESKDAEVTTTGLSDIKLLRKRARQNIEEGAVTSGYAAEREPVIKMLNEALATELICVLRYKRHYFMASGIHAAPVAAEFLEHATQEMQHADSLAKRIVELGGEPNFSPDGLSERSHAEYIEGSSLQDMIKENLIAERIAVESYREMIGYLMHKDSTTQRMLEDILAVEEEHADDLSSLLVGMVDSSR
jgi:bacterioferritin